MAKQLNVNLAFTADITKAKQQLQDLQRTLSTLATDSAKNSPLGITNEISKAITDVSKLQAALKNSTSQTGKLDLGQFRQELDKAGLDAQKISYQLRTLGPDGVKAFSQLTQSIMNAELPLRRTNTLLNSFATTLKNTARWQLSSNILHGFVGSIQSAYYYAQDLNESLNNIRIVTGKSTDEMAAFAEQANDAAKALSTTTTNYTDAALIYYQQGLEESDVLERTDVTVKLANVARESAEDVSQQMTAIWNNFYDGSKSLEYYADVMTALGAATASSTDEISEGLEKFASVADTVGLSYEYATSALATVTATTRQSADVVGNAFKTLFARLEGLNLGETLDDGTTLNKYSEALDKVGINIKTVSGEMKTMDQLLDEMGSKWDTLNQDQQIALAQTVAGVRQYTQLIALMDNWDFFKENLQVAQNAEGALQKQADIYAESWEAAKKRVTAALEDIYNDIFDDELFIDLANALAKVTKGVGNLVEAFGGLAGLLPFISNMILKMFGTEITSSLDNFVYRLKIRTEEGKQAILETRRAFNQELIDMTADETVYGAGLAEIYRQRASLQGVLIEKTRELNDIGKQITEQEELQVKISLEKIDAIGKEVEETLKLKEVLEEEIAAKERSVIRQGADRITNVNTDKLYSKEALETELQKIHEVQVAYNTINTLKEEFFKASSDANGKNDSELQKNLQGIIEKLDNMAPSVEKAEEEVNRLKAALKDLAQGNKTPEQVDAAFIKLEDTLATISNDRLNELKEGIKGQDSASKQLRNTIDELSKSYEQAGINAAKAGKEQYNYSKAIRDTQSNINSFNGGVVTLTQQFVLVGQTLSSFGMSLSALRGIFNTINDETLSLGEKITNVTISLGMFFSSAIRLGELSGKALTNFRLLLDRVNASIIANTIAQSQNNGVRALGEALTQKSNLSLNALILKTTAMIAAIKEETHTEEKQIIVEELHQKLQAEGIALTTLETEQLYNLIIGEQTQITTLGILEGIMGKILTRIKLLLAAYSAFLPYIAAIAAAVAVLSIGYKLYTDNLKKTAAAEVAQAKALKEQQDALVETKDNIVSLTKSYEDLTEKVKTNADFTSDLRTQVFDLCNQYGLYDLAIKALIEDYDTLGDSIKEVQIEQDKKIILTSESTQNKTQSAIGSKIWSESKMKQRDLVPSTEGYSRSFDVGLFTNRDLAESLYNDFSIRSDIFGHISVDDFVKAATEQREELVKALEASSSEDAKKLLDLINNNQELFDIYSDAVAQHTEALRDKIAQENSMNISSYEDYINSVRQITKEIENTFKDEEDPAEAARKYAETKLSELEGNVEYAKKIALSSQIATNIGEDTDEVTKKLAKYDSTSLAFIASHTEQIKQSKEGLDGFIKSTEHYLDITSNIHDRDSVVGLLQSLATGEEYNEEQLSELFSKESNFGMKQEEFEALGKGEQTVALLHYFAENQQAIEENKEKTIAELEEYKTEAGDKLKEINQEIEELKEKNAEYLEEGYLSKFTGVVDEEYLNVAEKMAQGLEDTFTKAEKEIAESIEDDTFISVPGDLEELRKYIKARKELKELEDSRDNISDEISAYEDATKAMEEATSAVNRMKAAHEGISAIGKEIDDIQSAYDSLNEIVKSYNKNNGFTLDTLQSLLALDPMYLQALEMDGNQLSINKEYLIELIKARLEDTKALIYEEGYNRLLALAERDASVAAAAAAIQQAEAGTAAEEAGLKAEAAAARWNGLTAAMHGQISAEARNIIADTEKRIQAVDNVINNLNVSSFNKIVGKSKSGGGSSKDKKELKDEIDRYYDLNNAISAVTNSLEEYNQQLDRLKSYQDHYKGTTLIKSLKVQNELIQKQTALLDKQIENYKAYYKEQSKELDELKTKISSFGGEFEGDVLTNYAKVMTDAVNTYNSKLDENAEKQYNKIKKALSRYQELYYSDMPETEQKVTDAIQEQLENQLKVIKNNLKGWEVEIELKLDTTEFKREWRDFIKTVEQDFRKVYKNLRVDSAATTDNFRTYLQDASTRMQEIYDVEAEIRKMEASKDENGVVQIDNTMLFGSISEAQEKLKELQKELVENGNNLQQLYEQVWDTYIDGLDQAADNFADITKEVEHLTNVLEYEKEIIELLYGDEAFDLMSRYYTTQQGNIEAQIYSTRVQAEFWEDQFYKAFNMNKDKHNVDLDDMATWTKDMRKAYDEMIESQETLNELIIKGIENFRDYYINNIAETLREMDKSIWGMKLDELKEDWDFIQKRADEYLDDVEGAYAIQTLANKINQSIAETTDLKYQQKLAKLREDEITMLREKERLTQDDIDLAEARYNIALKEMALEEAQNSKTGMKLVRDTSGNWTYQYVADDEDVLNKQQELLDSYNNLYKIADEAYKHAMELAMEMYEEYKDKIKEIAEDITLSEEEKMIKIKELQNKYLPEIQAAMENAKIYEQETIMAAAATFAEVCEQDADAYTTLTDLQKELVDEVKEQHLEDYEEIREAILNNYDEILFKAKESFEEMNENSKTTAADVIRQWDKNTNDSVKGAMNEAFTAIQKYTKEFENELYHLEDVSGIAIIEPGGVVSDIEAIGETIDEVIGQTQSLADIGSSNLDVLRGFVNEVENAWDGVIGKINDAISSIQEYLSYMESVAGMEMPTLERETSNYNNSNSKNSGNGGSGNGSGSGKGNDTAKSKGLAVLDGYTVYSDPNGVPNTVGVEYNGKLQTIIGYTDEIDKTKKIHKYFTQRGYSAYGAKFASGGYTGEWGTDGRLAVLHQKELVLNQDDTLNMLSAVKAIRDIAGLNESISQTIASSIGQLIMHTIAAGGGNFNSGTNNNTNNVFNITAEFPNADDVQTIRDAILSLPNLASQFVNER